MVGAAAASVLIMRVATRRIRNCARLEDNMVLEEVFLKNKMKYKRGKSYKAWESYLGTLFSSSLLLACCRCRCRTLTRGGDGRSREISERLEDCDDAKEEDTI